MFLCTLLLLTRATMYSKQMKYSPVMHSTNRPETWDEFISLDPTAASTNPPTHRHTEGGANLLTPNLTLDTLESHQQQLGGPPQTTTMQLQGITKIPMSFKR